MADDQEPLDIELANLKKLNGVIEKVIAALDTSTLNTEKVDSTVQNADRLLDLWIRVLARSDQAQKLILDENWHGATSDLHAIEAEQSQASRKAQEQQQYLQARREQEEREAAERREREEQRAHLSSSTSTARGRGTTTSTRGRGTGRGTTVKKEVVSAYAQTARPKTNSTIRPPAATTTTSARSVSGPTSTTSTGASSSSGIVRGRGVPIAVRGTRASRGRQQGLGRTASAEQSGFK